jgi:hypothetical protein
MRPTIATTGTLRRMAGRGFARIAGAAALAGCLAAPMATGTAAASGTASSPVDLPSLASVSCTSASSCMAVGSFLGSKASSTLAETWNGTAWTVVPSPTPSLATGGGELGSVSCASSTSCIAVGLSFTSRTSAATRPLAESWNGTKWTLVSTPKLAHAGASLDGVSCTSPSSCMAVGSAGTAKDGSLSTLAESWNGTAWKALTTPPPLARGDTALSSVACTAPASCMAAGFYRNTIKSTPLTLAEVWNGTTWRILATPNPGSSGTLSGVACTAASACLAVGGHRHSGTFILNATLSEQWNGHSWRVRSSPNPGSANFAGFDGISCTGPAACMATGFAAGEEGESGITLAESWNGTSWSLLKAPSPGSSSDELLGVSCTSPSSCMAVGDFQSSGPQFTLAEAWNGAHWRVVKTPHP